MQRYEGEQEMSYDARIIADSIGPNGARVTTFELTMPRIVLAEFGLIKWSR